MQSNPMHIKSLYLKNFRQFKNLSIDFDDRLTVLVGANGTGKSAILDALAVSLSTFLHHIPLSDSRSISKEDALLKPVTVGSTTERRESVPVSIEAEGQVFNEAYRWERTLNKMQGRTTYGGAKKVVELSEEWQKRLEAGDTSLILPIISYYGTGRLWAQKRQKRESTIQGSKREYGYADCLSYQANLKLMYDWLKRMTEQEIQELQEVQELHGPQAKYRIPELGAVLQAVENCFKGVAGCDDVKISFNIKQADVMVDYTNELERQRFPLHQLSDGYRTTLSMVADIAYRMATLNPQLGENVASETPGIVLIDEIDLHLHPIWQTRVLSDLQSTFPKVQFIVTTHAPAVIASVRRENLRKLDGQDYAATPSNQTYGRDASAIFREVMDAPERPVEILNLFSNFYAAVDRGDYDRARCDIRTIESLIGKDDADLSGAKTALFLAQD